MFSPVKTAYTPSLTQQLAGGPLQGAVAPRPCLRGCGSLFEPFTQAPLPTLPVRAHSQL